jgi:hypothetical protein
LLCFTKGFASPSRNPPATTLSDFREASDVDTGFQQRWTNGRLSVRSAADLRDSLRGMAENHARRKAEISRLVFHSQRIIRLSKILLGKV